MELPYYRGGTLYAYRVDNWKLHFVLEGAYGQPPEKEVLPTPVLYNLARDPSEKFDVAADNPEVVARILSAVAAHQTGLQKQPPLFDVRLSAL